MAGAVGTAAHKLCCETALEMHERQGLTKKKGRATAAGDEEEGRQLGGGEAAVHEHAWPREVGGQGAVLEKLLVRRLGRTMRPPGC